MHMHHNVVDAAPPIIVAHSFNGTELMEIEYEGRPVFLASQVGLLLGYADPQRVTGNITAKWSEDLVEGQDIIRLTNGKLASFKTFMNCMPEQHSVDPHTRSLILLTESGAQLVAMLARTPQGRAFRRWLVDEVLPAWRQRHQPPAPPVAAAPEASPRGRRPKALPAPAPVAEAQLTLRPPPRPTLVASAAETVEERLANAVRLGSEPGRTPTHRELLVGQVLSVVRGHCPRAPYVAALVGLAGEAPPVSGSTDPEVIAMTQAIWLVGQLTDAQVVEARREMANVVLKGGVTEPFVSGTVLALMRRELLGMPDHALYDVLAYAANRRRAAGLPPGQG
jgi:prophage antirepressor-like protein